MISATTADGCAWPTTSRWWGLFLTGARICISAAHSVADLNYALEIITRHGTLCGFRYFGDLADKGLIQIPDALQPQVLGL